MLVMLVMKVFVAATGLVTGVAVLVVLVRKLVLVVLAMMTGSVLAFDSVCLFRLTVTNTIATAIIAAAATNPNETSPSLYF